MKKILILPSLIFILFFTFACTSNNTTTTTNKISTTTVNKNATYTLPDFTGKTKKEIEEWFAEHSDINRYTITVKPGLEYGDEEGQYSFDTFYGFSGESNVAGSEYKYSKNLTVYVTAGNLPTSLEDFVRQNPTLATKAANVTMANKSYENKSFLETGLGEVTAMSYVDGDTTRFKDKNGTSFSLRYLGVDTPESTASFEAWGKVASAFTESSLSNAKKIVLEAEEAGKADSNGRYLGWVWYQAQDDSWHLLNLELVLFCYSKDKAESDTYYGDLITSIGTIVGATGRRVWGEKDPGYDYSTDPKEVSIKELKENFGSYYSRKVKITGVIALVDEVSVVIVDPETNYGVYFYIPSWYQAKAYDMELGNKITIIGVATYYGITDDDLDAMDEDLGKGSPQLTDFIEKNVTVIESGITINPVEITISDLSVSKIGMYVTIKNLTIKKVYEASTGSGYSVTCKDSSNKEIVIRVDNSHYHHVDGDNGINKDAFTVGGVIDEVTGYISYYSGYQLSLVGESFIEFAD